MSKSEAALLAAIERGPLVHDKRLCGARGGPVWRFGQRWFQSRDVKLLIERGLAVRIGNQVVKA